MTEQILRTDIREFSKTNIIMISFATFALAFTGSTTLVTTVLKFI